MVAADDATVTMPWIGWDVISWVMEQTYTGVLEDSDEPDRERIAATADEIIVRGISQVRAAGLPDRGVDPGTEVRLTLPRPHWKFVLAELADFTSRTQPGDADEQAAEIARAAAALISPAITASDR